MMNNSLLAGRGAWRQDRSGWYRPVDIAAAAAIKEKVVVEWGRWDECAGSTLLTTALRYAGLKSSPALADFARETDSPSGREIGEGANPVNRPFSPAGSTLSRQDSR